jgi:hypothetical protein
MGNRPAQLVDSWVRCSTSFQPRASLANKTLPGTHLSSSRGGINEGICPTPCGAQIGQHAFTFQDINKVSIS